MDFRIIYVAVAPILLLIILMAVLRWSATRAAAVTLVLTAVSSSFIFQAGPELMFFESLKGVWNSATILWIIFPAILLYEVVTEAGCIEALNQGLERISPHELFKILTIGWVFAGFLQGITGFGVPVAICVPILMGFGVKPVMAAAISLLGQAWGNTFGTLAVAWDMLADIAGLEGETLLRTAWITAMFLWLLDLISGLMICWFYGRMEGIRQGFLYVAIVSLIQGGGEVLVSQINQSVAAFIPATAAMAFVFLLARLPGYRKEYRMESSPIMERKTDKGTILQGSMPGMAIVFSPYIVLIGVTIILLVIGPVNAFLKQWSIGFAFPETSTAWGFTNAATSSYSTFYPLVDSGTVLMITCILSYLILHHAGCFSGGAVGRILKRTWKKVKPSAASVLLLLMISKLMSGSGQTLLIAEGATAVLGDKYSIFCGLLGLIGSFITGSNMSSNILFTDVQVNAAAVLRTDCAGLLAAQTSSAAAGSIISPSKIILGTTSGGIAGKEGEILRLLLPLAVGFTIAAGLICWIIF